MLSDPDSSRSTLSGESSQRNRKHRAASALLLATLAVVGVVLWASRRSPEQVMESARRAMQQRDFQTARSEALLALDLDPELKDARLLAATASAEMDDVDGALRLYAQVPDDGSRLAVEARCAAGDLLLKEKHSLTLAEEQFRRAVEQDEDSFLAHDRLAFILGVATRSHDMVPHQIMMLRLGDVTPLRLYALSIGERLPTDPEIVQEYFKASPDDPNLLLGVAQVARADQQFDRTLQLLQRTVQHAPRLIEAQLRLGELLLETDSSAAFQRWHSALPVEAEDRAAVWVIRGRFLLRQQQTEAAARCFWEAVRRDPNHQPANYQLGQTLVSLNRVAEAQPFLERSDRLEEYVNLVFANAFEAPQGEQMAETYDRIASLATALDLAWEAYGWKSLAARARAPEGQIRANSETRLESPPVDLITRSPQDANPASRVDFSSVPLPEWDAITDRVTPADDPRSETSVRFTDQAAAAGLEFRYFNGVDTDSPGTRIHETMGGGVAAVDYDSDGWTDLYLTQGCHWPPDPKDERYSDALYRNRGNGSFAETTFAARIRESGFGQGVTVGDFDNDGFADVYVANVGRNVLYRNHGDGTFEEVELPAAAKGARWTTSCVMADVDGDGAPDLFETNYLAGDDALEATCRGPNGEPRVCPPNMFPGEGDRLFLNAGNGRFRQPRKTAGIELSSGKGLGVVAGNFDDSGSIGIFVANDQVSNSFYVRRDLAERPLPGVSDDALMRGLALNGEGRAEACMGVAAGDANGDGRLDLFVTNFSGESNTLYLQHPGGLFEDATHAAELALPSMKYLGFGTQFIDGELDGRLDLLLVNGHIDDRQSDGELYRMPPQYFANRGSGRFVEVNAEQLGPFFAENYLGRSLARLDWNRDGLEDAAISHLDSPVTLLTNVTSPHGHFLAIRLTGVTSDRDAIGAVVTVRRGTEILVRQLTAGDGFQASNERLLTFGLGDTERIDELVVRWTSGRTQRFVDLAVDGEWMLVEGRDRPVSLSKGHSPSR